MRHFFLKLKPIFSNKFFLATLLFVIWMAFFDPKDWESIAERTNKLHELQKSEQQLIKQIADRNLHDKISFLDSAFRDFEFIPPTGLRLCLKSAIE